MSFDRSYIGFKRQYGTPQPLPTYEELEAAKADFFSTHSVPDGSTTTIVGNTVTTDVGGVIHWHYQFTVNYVAPAPHCWIGDSTNVLEVASFYNHTELSPDNSEYALEFEQAFDAAIAAGLMTTNNVVTLPSFTNSSLVAGVTMRSGVVTRYSNTSSLSSAQLEDLFYQLSDAIQALYVDVTGRADLIIGDVLAYATEAGFEVTPLTLDTNTTLETYPSGTVYVLTQKVATTATPPKWFISRDWLGDTWNGLFVGAFYGDSLEAAIAANTYCRYDFARDLTIEQCLVLEAGFNGITGEMFFRTSYEILNYTGITGHVMVYCGVIEKTAVDTSDNYARHGLLAHYETYTELRLPMVTNMGNAFEYWPYEGDTPTVTPPDINQGNLLMVPFSQVPMYGADAFPDLMSPVYPDFRAYGAYESILPRVLHFTAPAFPSSCPGRFGALMFVSSTPANAFGYADGDVDSGYKFFQPVMIPNNFNRFDYLATSA